MAEPKFPKYTPPEGYKPPKQAGAKTEIGKGNRPAPQREGESDEAFKARSAQWMKSYQARGGVKIANMNQGQLNKFAASGGANRSAMIGSRINQYMQKHPGGSGNTPTQGPSSTPQDLPPGSNHQTNTPGGGPGGNGPRNGNQGMTARGGSAQSTGGFGGPMGSMGASSSLSRMPGRRARRRARRMAGRS